MKQRNWEDLSRKLVDRTDLKYTLAGLSTILGQYALSFFGEGVLNTTQYPNPFPITLSSLLMGGNVGGGIGYDYLGNFVSIPSDTGNPSFTIEAADVSNPRYDLLCIQYKQTGDTLIPKPSDPLTTVYLNLHDDYVLYVRKGTPSGTPAYPTKETADIILAGIQVPAGVSLGSECLIDLSIRELGVPDRSKLPVFSHETLSGIVDGTNKIFTLSMVPVSSQSLIIFLNGIGCEQGNDYTIDGDQITFLDAPKIGQTPHAWIIAAASSSQNPLSALQETPSGTIDGANDTFYLTGNPPNKDALILFKDGLVVPKDEFSFIQGPTGNSIKFASTSIPERGQGLYVFFLQNVASVGTSSSGGGGSSTGGIIPQYRTLTAADIASKGFTLSHTPSTPAYTIFDIPSGAPQIYNSDFAVTGNFLTWDGLALDGVITSGMAVRVLIPT